MIENGKKKNKKKTRHENFKCKIGSEFKLESNIVNKSKITKYENGK